MVSSISFRGAVLAAALLAVSATPSSAGCVSLCQESGCGANVGGGCYHLCGRVRPSAAAAQLERYRTIAESRKLDRAASSSTFVGVVRIREVREVSLHETFIDATLVSTWAGSIADEKIRMSVSGRDHCDPSTYQAQVNHEVVALLVAQGPDSPYKVAGFGWGLFPVVTSQSQKSAVGYPPSPKGLRHTTEVNRYRVPTWHAPIEDLRTAILRAREPR